MYCPNCELDIKGEDKKECPICGSALVENPFEGGGPGSEGFEDDLKLKELIDDIDIKVHRNLEESIDADAPPFPELRFDNAFEPEGPADVNESLGATGDEPEFTLDVPAAPVSERPPDEPETLDAVLGDMQDEAGALQSELERSLDAIMVPGAESRKQADAEDVPPVVAEPPPDEAKATSVIEDFSAAVDDTAAVTEESVAPADSGEPAEEHLPLAATAAGENDTGEAPGFEEERGEVPSAREVLDRALDELDQDFQPGHREKRSAAGPVLLVLLVALLAGAGGYYVYETYLSPGTAEQQFETDGAPAAVVSAERIPAVPAGDSAAPATPPKPEVKKSAAADRAPRDGAVKPPVAKPAQKPASAAAEPAAPASKPAKPAVEAKPARMSAAPEKPPVISTARQLLYSIHAGSYRKQDVARSEVSRLGTLGFSAYVQQADLGSRGVWYRVKIGDFETRAEAEAIFGKLKKKDTVPARIVLKRD